MENNLTAISEFMKDKNVCILGNARSILNTKKDIDGFEVVCRINRGTPRGKGEFIGSRTDVLFLATKMEGKRIKSDFNPTFVVWTTECRNLALPWVLENAIQNPPEDWRELKSIFPDDKLPSTGLVAINFLLKHIDFKSLTIYGFDNFFSSTWYNNVREQPWHEGKIERIIILNLIKNSKKEIKWITE